MGLQMQNATYGHCTLIASGRDGVWATWRNNQHTKGVVFLRKNLPSLWRLDP
jgi:hypothetical protein